MELLIGTQEGDIYLFDPVLRSKSEIKNFNFENNHNLRKNRQIDLIVWIEPPPSHQVPQKFIAIFDDGVICIFNKENPFDRKADLEKEILKIKADVTISKAQLIKKMQVFVDQYSFDPFYKTKKPSFKVSDKIEILTKGVT